MNKKVEDYIEKHTQHDSNEIAGGGWVDGEFSRMFQPWVKPDYARAAAMIAEEQILGRLADHGYSYGSARIAEERMRQIEVEGYDAMHDRHHTPQVLCRAALAYALHEDPSGLVADAAAKLWPWNKDFWKPKDQMRNLVRAGALIAAAIDRLHADTKEVEGQDDRKDRKFILSHSVREIAGGILYITVNVSERWPDCQIFRTYPGKGLLQISFYEGEEEFPETIPMSEGFDQHDYQFTSQVEKDQMTIVGIPVDLLRPRKGE
jgi:hypothetical protein